MGPRNGDAGGGGDIGLEPMAVGWGGLVGTIGLAASAAAPLWVRALAIIGAFLIGGFLAGVRTLDHRSLNGIVAAFGGPTDPEFAPGSDGASLLIAAASLLAAAVGGLAADRRYSARRIRQRY